MPANNQDRRALNKKIRRALLAVGFLAPAVLAGSPALAAVRAVTVGVDYYADGLGLAGAINDANMIRKALRDLNVEVTPLLDRDATRTSLIAEVRAHIARSKPGDTVLLTIAAHGSQLPALDPRTEPDDPDGAKMDEIILFSLADKDDPQKNSDQYIRDDDLAALWREARSKQVLFVGLLDTCHSGTGMRGSPDTRGALGRSRSGFALEGFQLPQSRLAPANAPAVSDSDLPDGVFFYTANLDSNVIREITYKNEWHGALSVAFAEALSGWAGSGTGGTLNHSVLAQYLEKRVNELASTTQIISWDPKKPDSRPMLPASVGAPAQPAATPPILTLRIDGMDRQEANRIAKDIPSVKLVAAGSQADLVWDAVSGDAISTDGDVVSTRLDRTALPGFVEKWQALKWLREQPVPGGRLSIKPDRENALYPAGSVLGISLPQTANRTLIMVNLGADGMVDMLYPYTQEEGNGFLQRDLSQPNFARSCPRFGAEHYIAVAVDGRPDTESIDLVSRLNSLNRTMSAWDVVTALYGWAWQRKAAIGQQILVTTEKSATSEVEKCYRKS